MKIYNLGLKKVKKLKLSNIKIAVYGLGKMGLPLAVVFAHKGFTVIGTDINSKIIDNINNGICPIVGEKGLKTMLQKVVKEKKLFCTTDGIEASKQSSIKIIIVPTYLDNDNNPDLSIVKDVTKKIAKGLHKGDIVILESTAPPGTTINVVGKILEKESGLKLNKDFSVAHCPERTSSGTAIADIMGRICPKIVGGSDKQTTQIMEYIYSKINTRTIIPVSNTITAELIKISEGVYRDVNIAFANNIYLICKEFGVDAMEVIKGCNTDAYCRILTPGPGVGGHCIPVYPYFLLKNTKKHNNLLKISRQINDNMSTHIIELTKGALEEKNVSFKSANILILGIAYRSGVKEIRKSPGIKIAKELMNLSSNVYCYDPLFTKEEISSFGLKYKNNYEDTDCLIITTDEIEFKNLPWKLLAKKVKTKIVIDTSNIVDPTLLKKLGFGIRRIGYAE